VGRETIEWVKKLGLQVSIYLYNPSLIEPIRTLFENMNQSLGGDYFRVSPLDTEAQLGSLLASFYQVRILSPIALAGTDQKFKLIGLEDEKEVAQESFQAEVPKRVYRHTLQKYAIWILLSAILAAGLGMIIFLIWYYKPKSCPQCHRWIRKTQRDCLFCSEIGHGVLIKPAPPQTVTSAYLESGSVYLLKEGKNEFGSYRTSPIRFKKGSGETAQPFFEILAVKNDLNEPVYRLRRLAPKSMLEIEVNQIAVHEERLLAAGDRIRVRDAYFTFYFLRSNDEQMAYS
jgi:hypothetical protein